MIPFSRAFDLTLEHEGIFSNDRNDSGNWTGAGVGMGKLNGTKFGISAAAYPDLNIRGLTKEGAKRIYKKDYWDVNLLDDYHHEIAILWFDALVNHGRRNANKMMQRSIGVNDDGIIGKKSKAALRAADPRKTSIIFLSKRLQFYSCIPTFNNYGRGWVRRITYQMELIANGKLI